MAPGALTILKRWWNSLTGGDPDADLSTEVSAAFGKTVEAVGVLPMLNMGRAPASGKFSLKGKHLACDWRREDSEDYFDRVLEAGQRLAQALGVDYEDNPLDSFFDQVLTAHPLGGCPMGENEHEGVVDKYGEVFNYQGLFVADGAVFPGPVGPNPSLTIAALADRFAEHIIEQAKGGQ
jgi:cholesterol oxidase